MASREVEAIICVGQCSMGKGRRRRRDLALRFWEKALIGDGCWEWQASRYPKGGHGQFHLDGHMVRAQRVAWILFYGEIPEGMSVLHHCDNAPCVRPDHLYLGTQADNMHDVKERGRHWRHTQTHCAKGHPLIEKPSGRRGCPVCDKAAKQASYRRHAQDPEWRQRKQEALQRWREQRRTDGE